MSPDRNTELARRLRELCFKKGWRQSDLARAASKFMPEGHIVSRQTISHIMTGRHLPSEMALVAIAAALDVPPQELVPPSKAIWLGGAPKKDAPEPAPTNEPKAPVSMTVEGDKARLRIDVEVPFEIAVEVMALLNKARHPA